MGQGADFEAMACPMDRQPSRTLSVVHTMRHVADSWAGEVLTAPDSWAAASSSSISCLACVRVCKCMQAQSLDESLEHAAPQLKAFAQVHGHHAA